MRIDPAGMDAAQLYKLLTGIVVPRPIAWVTTVGADGVVNAAPFSAFTFVSNKPPMILISVGRIDGRRKDTSRNIFAAKSFVVNIVSEALLPLAHASSAPYAPHESETEILGIELAPSERVRAPRIARSLVQMECVLHSSVEYGSEGSEAIVGEVVCFHVDDAIIDNGKIDQRRLAPVARLGGPTYATLGELLNMPGYFG